jgi:hypothetical protein
VLVLLLGSTAYAHDDHSSGPEVKAYKALPLFTLPDLAVNVSPTFPQLDNGLAFDRVNPADGAGLLVAASPERLHYRLIDAGRGSSTIRTITS